MDAVNRALCKTHELDEYLLPALLQFAYHYDQIQPDAEKTNDHSHLYHLVNGLRENFVARQKLVATNTGMVVAIRRRDNVAHIDLVQDSVPTVVSRSIDRDTDEVVR